MKMLTKCVFLISMYLVKERDNINTFIEDSLRTRFYGVMVSTLDFESSNPSSNLGRTFKFFPNLFILFENVISCVKCVESLIL
jgi:hypothetical protein